MPEIGFAFSSEDHGPQELVRQARAAEQAGFSFGLISDHFHPWVSKQGNSPSLVPHLFLWDGTAGTATGTGGWSRRQNPT